MEVASDRHHTGTSEQGAKLDLKYEDGTVMGTLTSPEGDQYPMLGADLATAYRCTDEFSKPGTYIAFVAPGSAWCSAAAATSAAATPA